MIEIKTVGLDLAKCVFQVHGADGNGQCVERRKLRRKQVVGYFAKLAPCVVGMEACSGAHYWARELSKLGHEVRLMAPRLVRPYVKRAKTDASDAAAICEAVSRPEMRFVAVKSEDQQAVLMLHRARELLVRQRTMLANSLRSQLVEFGIVVARGIHRVRDLVEQVLLAEPGEEATGPVEPARLAELPEAGRTAIGLLAEAFVSLDMKVRKLEREITSRHWKDATCRRLADAPGIGVITASALVATIGTGEAFRSGRQFAAWLGVVPRVSSSGGKSVLGSIGKRGDPYLRRLLIHGARAVIAARRRKPRPGQTWVQELIARKHINVAAVALANKTARIVWAMLTRGEEYRHAKPARAA